MNGSPDMMRRMIEYTGDKTILETQINAGKVDLIRVGGDLLYTAAFHGRADIVDLLVDRGSDIHNPPDAIKGEDSYRKTSHLITAVVGGDVPTLEAVMRAGRSINDRGFITFSKKRKNLVTSNIVGAAAYWGKKKMLAHLLENVSASYLNAEAIEDTDYKNQKETKLVKEMSKYTPLMLCVAKGDENLDCVKMLLRHSADYKRKDEYNNTILHIAAINGSNKILEYIAKHLKVDIFDRNKSGETALSICKTIKNAEGEKILEKFSDEYDTSKNLAEDLLNQLDKEDQQDVKAKAQRKVKKYRNKINKLAKQLNISPEEVEERLKKEEEEKKEAELEE
jgi:ankyrin repeat protein